MSYFIHGLGWSTLSSIGRPEDKLEAHAKLTVNKVNDREVEIATLTERGQIVVYRIRRTGNAWTSDPRVITPDPHAAPAGLAPPSMPLGTIMASADRFRINPFGDLSICRPAGNSVSVIYCAGLRNGDNKMPKRDLSSTGIWQYFV